MNMHKQSISLKEDGDKRIVKNIKKQKEENLKIIEKSSIGKLLGLIIYIENLLFKPIFSLSKK